MHHFSLLGSHDSYIYVYFCRTCWNKLVADHNRTYVAEINPDHCHEKVSKRRIAMFINDVLWFDQVSVVNKFPSGMPFRTCQSIEHGLPLCI